MLGDRTVILAETSLGSSDSDNPDAPLTRADGMALAEAIAGARRKRLPFVAVLQTCLLYTSPSPRDATLSRMPSSA